MDRVGNTYRIHVMGDVNGWIGDKVRTGITTGDNDNEKEC